MTDNLRESISALMDDEANELELRRVLSSMEHDDEVRNTWKRYQISRLAMKGKLPEYIDFDISGRIAEAIADEGVVLESGSNVGASRWGRVFRPVTSVAVAASVAFLVVFGVLQVNPPTSGPGLANQNTPSESSALFANQGATNQSILPVNSESLTPSQKRLRALIDSHTQQADISRGRAFMPYGQLVSDSESQRY